MLWYTPARSDRVYTSCSGGNFGAITRAVPMDGQSFHIYADFVQRERVRVADLHDLAEICDRRYAEAWFVLMSMGHADATDDDKARAGDNLQIASSEQAAAREDAAEAARRLALYEDFLMQCAPSAT